MTAPRSPALERLAAAHRRYELMAEAVAAGFGPDTKGAERKAKVLELRAAGCTIAEIADLFGVSGQMIRQLLGLAPKISGRELRQKRQAADGN
jgi:hypothetical protein